VYATHFCSVFATHCCSVYATHCCSVFATHCCSVLQLMLYASIQCNSISAHSIHCNTLQQCVPLPWQRSNTRWRRGRAICCSTCTQMECANGAAAASANGVGTSAATVSTHRCTNRQCKSCTATRNTQYYRSGALHSPVCCVLRVAVQDLR